MILGFMEIVRVKEIGKLRFCMKNKLKMILEKWQDNVDRH